MQHMMFPVTSGNKGYHLQDRGAFMASFISSSRWIRRGAENLAEDYDQVVISGKAYKIGLCEFLRQVVLCSHEGDVFDSLVFGGKCESTIWVVWHANAHTLSS